jgi:dihydrofolate reductase
MWGSATTSAERMKRICYAVAASLDGYIAGPNGEADWIIIDPEIDFEALFKRFDTVFMGRRTFAAMEKMGQGPMSGMETFVFSRTLEPRKHSNVTILGDKAEETVAALRAKRGKDIWLFGGGSLFRSLLAAGLVDTVEVAIVPILLGDGIPLLPSLAARTELKLMKHRVYKKTGIISIEYSVRHTP